MYSAHCAKASVQVAKLATKQTLWSLPKTR